jgi:hypothetical protein
MPELLKKEWQKVEGNAKWDFYKWLVGLPPWERIGAVVITFSISLFSYVKGVPWPVWAFLFLGTFCLATIFSLLRETKTQVAAVTDVVPIVVPQMEEKLLDLKLIPHSDNDTSVYLEVLNQGEKVEVDAQLRIVGLSTNDAYKTLPFGGEWRSELANTGYLGNQFFSYAGSVRIEPHKSRLLTIASIASMAGASPRLRL